MIISSKSNDLIKYVRNLKDKKYRDLNQEFCIEGKKILEEAIDENAQIEKILIDNDLYEQGELVSIKEKLANFECVYVTSDVMQSISDVKTPQGIVAVIKKESDVQIDFNQNLYVILDGVQDPGNIGTIIRTCDSLNIKYVFVRKGTCDVYNPKVVRSTMGAIFRVKIVEFENISDIIDVLRENNVKIYATDLQASKSIYATDFKNSAIIIGNEANGVSQQAKELSDHNIKIPMLGKTESLNVAVATGIILYEAIRQINFDI